LKRTARHCCNGVEAGACPKKIPNEISKGIRVLFVFEN
jgi:hypothetical protein